jgi:hypothetical protein
MTGYVFFSLVVKPHQANNDPCDINVFSHLQTWSDAEFFAQRGIRWQSPLVSQDGMTSQYRISNFFENLDNHSSFIKFDA